MKKMKEEILLAIVQGITEFLPISSSGHLALLSNLFSETNFSLIIYLHLASLLAVLIYFRKKIKKIFLEEKKIIFFVIVGIIPAGIFGILFKEYIEKTFSSLLFIGISFLITSIFLFISEIQKNKKKLDLKSSFIIGLFQVLSLFPGVSRSGITISSARFIGINKEEAFDFSFLMFIPLALASFFLETLEKDLKLSFNIILPFLVCFFVSYLSLITLNKILKEKKFWIFGIYCFLIGIITIILYFL